MGTRTGGTSVIDTVCGRPTMKSLFVKGFVLIIALWFLIVGLMSVLPVNQSANGHATNELSSPGEATEILERIDAALQEIQMLKKNNAEMKRIIESNNPSVELNSLVGRDPHDDLVQAHPEDPSATYEDTRRQIELNLKELWYNIRSKSEHLEEIDFEQVTDIYRWVTSFT